MNDPVNTLIVHLVIHCFMCPNCEQKNKKIYELSLRLGIKKRQNEILKEELENANAKINYLRVQLHKLYGFKNEVGGE